MWYLCIKRDRAVNWNTPEDGLCYNVIARSGEMTPRRSNLMYTEGLLDPASLCVRALDDKNGLVTQSASGRINL